MAWAKEPASLEYDDDELLDRMTAEYEPPSYPYGCRFDLDEADLIKAAGEAGKPGDTLKFAAMAEVTSVFSGRQDSRVELQISEFAGEDGEFHPIKDKPDDATDDETWRHFGCICLSNAELEKMGLEADCERGDTIHLIGELQLENIARNERGEMANLQITRLTFAEDESDESREG